MKLLRPQVGVRDDLTEQQLKSRLLSADICISDLDNTDTRYSPAKDLAWNRVGVNSTAYGYLKLLSWAVWTGLCFTTAFSSSQVVQAIEKVKEQQFKDYYKTFLRSADAGEGERSNTALKEVADEEIKSMLTPEYIAQSLFPGVKEFYQALPATKRYLSRNLYPVVKAYAVGLGFEHFDFDVKNKPRALESLIGNNPSWKRLILRSDHAPGEEEMIALARFYQQGKNPRLEDVLVIKRSQQLAGYHLTTAAFQNCEVLIGSNDYGLVEIMTDKPEQYKGMVTVLGRK